MTKLTGMTRKRILILSMVVHILLFAFSCNRNNADESNNFYSEIRSVNKLILGQMTISKMASVDDINLEDAEGIKQISAGILDAIKIGKRKAAYSYNTYLQGFIDLSSLEPEDIQVSDSKHSITINLPAIQTEFTGRDMEIQEEHYRVTGLRSEIDSKERAAIKEEMNKSLKAEVENNPVFRDKLIEQSRIKAESYFKSILGKNGYVVTVNFK